MPALPRAAHTTSIPEVGPSLKRVRESKAVGVPKLAGGISTHDSPQKDSKPHQGPSPRGGPPRPGNQSVEQRRLGELVEYRVTSPAEPSLP